MRVCDKPGGDGNKQGITHVRTGKEFEWDIDWMRVCMAVSGGTMYNDKAHTLQSIQTYIHGSD